MDSTTLEKLLTHLIDEVGGDWLVAGGTLVRLIFDSSRGTEDIDLLRIRHPVDSNEVSLDKLYQFALSIGSGPEWINTAMAPFVRAAPGWESHIVPLRRGKSGTLHRPTLTLFAYLKLERGSEIDIQDLEKAFQLTQKRPEEFSEKTLEGWLSLEGKKLWLTLRPRLLQALAKNPA